MVPDVPKVSELNSIFNRESRLDRAWALQLERLEHLEPLEQISSVYIPICLIMAWVSGLLSSNNFADMV